MEKYTKMAEEWFYTIKVNHEIFTDLRELTTEDCLIVSNLDLMRGVDYRSKKSGIELLLANDFPNTRSLE